MGTKMSVSFNFAYISLISIARATLIGSRLVSCFLLGFVNLLIEWCPEYLKITLLYLFIYFYFSHSSCVFLSHVFILCFLHWPCYSVIVR
jgi:hypothetical protein